MELAARPDRLDTPLLWHHREDLQPAQHRVDSCAYRPIQKSSNFLRRQHPHQDREPEGMRNLSKAGFCAPDSRRNDEPETASHPTRSEEHTSELQSPDHLV